MMSETATANSANPSRVFVSYSRSDRNRVAAVRLLLESLGHTVFLDHLTIRAGQKWEAKIKAGLEESDVFLVFWSKYAARSPWVRKEYEHFLHHSPDKPLMPIAGDETPLPEILGARQSLDFCPLLNELLELKKDLAAKGVSKKEINRAVLKRLDEAGVLMNKRQRRRFLRLFGVAGIATTSLILLTGAVDKGIDAMSQLSAAQVATVGALAVGGAVTYEIAVPTATSEVHLVEIVEGQSGSEACYQRGMSCISLTTMNIHDSDKKFFGFATPSCDSQVVKRPSCVESFGTEFAIDNVLQKKSPNADEGVQNFTGLGHVCLSSDAGKQGTYEFAYCVER